MYEDQGSGILLREISEVCRSFSTPRGKIGKNAKARELE